MGKYTIIKQAEKEHPEIHPIWRGVGFILMIITPLMAYAAAMLLLDENKQRGWVQIPAQFYFPNFSIPDIAVIAFLTLIMWVVLYAVFSLITFLVFRLFGPPRYGDTDVPPITRKVRKRWKE
jgi:hypothetical protein